jgi:predicted CXXCH cytochrome family protein
MRLLTIFLRDARLRRVWGCCAALFCVAAGLTAHWWLPSDRQIPPKEDSAPPVAPLRGLPQTVTDGGYASSSACQSCHPQQYASWHKTYHRRMTQPANVDAVLAPFNGEEFSVDQLTLRMTRRDNEFWVERQPSPKAKDVVPRAEAHRIVMTTGSHHMQGYWLRRDGSNVLSQLPLMWLLEDDGHGRWAPRVDCFLCPPGAPIKPTPWNMNCICCHSVNGVPGIDPYANLAKTTVAELGIACEACHGPGQAHVAVYKDVMDERRDAGKNAAIDAAIVNPKRLPPERSAQVCGRCHALIQLADAPLYRLEDWFQLGNAYRPGDDLNKTRSARSPFRMPIEELNLVLKNQPDFIESNFWPDGMVRVGGREYNGLLESPCYQRGGMTCLDCHSLHESDPNDQLATGMETNEACYRCHSSHREQIETHSHHPTDSSGSSCYNCHMPHTSYALFKGIRSHQISSPDVAVTLDTGRPNACNLCHLDQTLAWTAEKLSQWYGQQPAQFDEDQQNISAALLWMLRGDAIQRALVAWSFRWQPARDASGDAWLPPFLARLLEDPYSAVRRIADRSLKKLGYDLNYDFLAPADVRTSVRREVVERWQRRADESNRVFPPRLLLGRGGRIRDEEVERLLSTRDDRPLRISE